MADCIQIRLQLLQVIHLVQRLDDRLNRALIFLGCGDDRVASRVASAPLAIRRADQAMLLPLRGKLKEALHRRLLYSQGPPTPLQNRLECIRLYLHQSQRLEAEFGLVRVVFARLLVFGHPREERLASDTVRALECRSASATVMQKTDDISPKNVRGFLESKEFLQTLYDTSNVNRIKLRWWKMASENV